MPMDLEGIAAGETELDVEFKGETCHLTYDPNQMSKQFRAEALRLQRAYTKSQRRLEGLLQRATLVVAEDGTEAAKAEDEVAEQAITEILQEDSSLKAQIDAAIASIVTSWDLTYSKKSPKRVPIFDDSSGVRKPHAELAKVPVEFEADVLNAIMKDAAPGEADGAMTSSNSVSTLRPTEKQVTSRRLQTGSRRSRRLRALQQ